MNASRRRFIQTVSTGIVLFPLRSLLAQDNSSKIRQAITSNQKDAEALLWEVTKSADDITDNLAANFAERETALRFNLYRSLVPVSTEELIRYVLPDRQNLASALRSEDLPLLPKEDEIKYQFVPRTEPSEKCDETILSVTVDIFLEALGLREIKEAIKEVVNKSPEIRTKIDELAKVFQLRDWEQAIEFVAAIMDLLSDAGIADLFIKVLGKMEGRRVWRRLLTKLGARFVPFVGQVYTAIAIGVALFNNKQRLLHAITCDSK